MGLFKGIKDMKDMMGAAPGLLEQSSQLSANAHAMAAQAAQQQAAGSYGGTTYAIPNTAQEIPAELLEPIAGVDLAVFAQISAGLAQYNYDQSKAVEIAAARGIDATRWQTALDGWNGRIASAPAVASLFNAYYTGRA